MMNINLSEACRESGSNGDNSGTYDTTLSTASQNATKLTHELGGISASTSDLAYDDVDEGSPNLSA